MATRFGMMPDAFEQVLRATVVPKECTREQFAAFLLVAKEYNLNPLTREIFAIPGRNGGIQSVVSVDGWINLINSHPQLDGIEFEDADAAITCRIWRKDRAKPCTVTEYLAECDRGTEPWRKWPRRMLRHKALIQCARYAFGFAGIVDPDEAERIPTGNGQRSAPPRDVTPPPPPRPQGDAGSPKIAAPKIMPDYDPNTGEIWDDPPPAAETSAKKAAPPPAAQTPRQPDPRDPGELPDFLDRRVPRRAPDIADAEIDRAQDRMAAVFGHDELMRGSEAEELNERDWLNQLEGAFSGCEDMVSLGLLSDKLMAEAHLAAPSVRRKAKQLLDQHAARIMEQDRDQGSVPQA
jgi:phage recombination protein Bet